MGLNTRQWCLKKFLENHFISGKFWSIEEIVEQCRDYQGNPLYTLNKNPYNHDKCIALSNDVRTINWSVSEGYKVIVKDKFGGIKLCETEAEFMSWREEELKPLVRKWEYLNNLKWKAQRDGTIPMINQADNPVKEPKVVEVYMKETPKREDPFDTIDIFGNPTVSSWNKN